MTANGSDKRAKPFSVAEAENATIKLVESACKSPEITVTCSDRGTFSPATIPTLAEPADGNGFASAASTAETIQPQDQETRQEHGIAMRTIILDSASLISNVLCNQSLANVGNCIGIATGL